MHDRNRPPQRNRAGEIDRAGTLFRAVTLRPRVILTLALLVLLAAASQLPRIVKDTRSDAFMPHGHPSLEQRDRIREIFGLSDPLVISVVAADQGTVFTPETMALVAELTDAVAEIPGVDTAKLTSLATESDIKAGATGLEVVPFLDDVPQSIEEAQAIGRAIMDFPLYVGSVVARDASATLIIAELEPDSDAGAVYDQALALAARSERRAGEKIHVAGEGGVQGYLGHYIDADVRRMLPLVLVGIGLALTLAYRTLRSVLLPLLVVIGGAALALGSMAAADVPYYLITTAMPVILVAIGVADGIHILGEYYAHYARTPDATQSELVIDTMREMWRPVTITSLTDMVGFLSLALCTDLPPFQAFGVFAAIGVCATWLLSLFVVPAALAVLKPRGARMFGVRRDDAEAAESHESDEARGEPIHDLPARLLVRFGRLVRRHPRIVLAAATGVAGSGALAIASLQLDYERIRYFRPDTEIRRAHTLINQHMDGTHYLDVMIEADGPDGLLDPDVLRRIEALQRHVEALPHVGGSTSIVDYLVRMHRAFSEDRPEAAVLPADRAGAAQLLLLYEMSGDREDLGKVLDFERRRANVRVALDSGRHSEAAAVVEASERLARTIFEGSSATATVSGRVELDHRWMQAVPGNHFASVVVALLAITACSAALFRSMTAGLLTALPVAIAVLGIYAFMVGQGFWLGITTSMFAAIAIGLGVDFAVHLIDRIRALLVDAELELEVAMDALYAETGRALFFNFGCVLLGFGVLSTSSIPTLVEFGLLTAVAVSGSFLGAITLIPLMVGLMRPRFLGLQRARRGASPGGTRDEDLAVASVRMP